MSEIGNVSIVVFTGLCDQDWNDSLIKKPATVNPDATMTTQNNREYFSVVEM